MRNAFIPLTLSLACLAGVSGQDGSQAINACPEPFTVFQPDGLPITVRFQGDQRCNYYADLNGYTILKSLDGRWNYAQDIGGQLVSSGLVVGRDDPSQAGLTKNLRPSVRASPTILSPAIRTTPAKGTIKNLVVLVRFADHADRPLPSRADIDVLFNHEGPDPLCPTGSVRDVYYQNSFGQMTLQSTVCDWVTVSQTEAYYADGQSGLCSKLHEGLHEALAAVDQTVDFSQFDVDKDGSIDAITFIHSGYGAEWGRTDSYGAEYHNRIWSHRWVLNNGYDYWPYQSGEGVQVLDYHISPGVWSLSGSEIGRIGVICHETGHFLGLPDYYDTDGGGQGIGSWCMMANSWGFDGSQHYPPHFSAWSKIQLGWITPTTVSTAGTYTLRQAETYPDVIKIDQGCPPGEFFLIENRQPVAFDAAMPQGGLVVFHVDEHALNEGNAEGYPSQPGWPANGWHYGYAVLQADGRYDLERGVNRGDAGDAFHAGGVSALTPTGIPSTNCYQDGIDQATGLQISAISAASTSMTCTIGWLTAQPQLLTRSLNLTAYAGYSTIHPVSLNNPSSSPATWRFECDGGFPLDIKTSADPDGPVYVWQDISSVGISVLSALGTSTWDDQAVLLDLGFAFPLFGQAYSKCGLTANGCLTFPGYNVPYLNGAFPIKPWPFHMLAAFWDDLYFNSDVGGDIFVYWDPGSSYCVIQYTKAAAWTDDGNPVALKLNCQVVLQSNGAITCYYQNFLTSGSASIGIQSGAGLKYRQISHNQTGIVTPGMAIRYAPRFQQNWMSITPDGTLPAQQSTSAQMTIDATQLAPGSYQGTLTLIRRDGSRDSIPVALEVIAVTNPRTIVIGAKQGAQVLAIEPILLPSGFSVDPSPDGTYAFRNLLKSVDNTIQVDTAAAPGDG